MLEVTFTTVIFVHETIITAGDDGYLYVWGRDTNSVIKKQHAHPRAPILTLHTTPGSSMFVSGGMDGKVVIWELVATE